MTIAQNRTIAAAASAGLLLALAAPLSASAHVTLSPYSAEPGSYASLTFHVPNEEATAKTVEISVTIPQTTPFPDVSYVPVPGWTTTLTTSKLDKPVKLEGNSITEAVTKITWRADEGNGLSAGQLQLFPLSVGPVPDTGRIVLATTQTYDDGDVVKWNETGSDAEHPAPILYVNDAPVASHDDDAEVTAATIDSAHPASTDVLARVLGILGLVVGAVGIVLAILATRRRPNAS